MALVLGLVIIAILAATGVIFNSSPNTPVESRTFGEPQNGNKVNVAGFAGAAAGGNRTDPSSTTVLPVGDADANVVPNALEGKLTFQNMNFKEEYSDPGNPEYMRIADSLSRELEDLLMAKNPDLGRVKVTVVDLK